MAHMRRYGVHWHALGFGARCTGLCTRVRRPESPEIVANSHGDYHIIVEGDYEESDCDVALVRSPRVDCSDPTEAWRKSRVVLTTLDGLSGKLRFANNLGFKKDVTLPQCTRILQEMGYYELNQEAEDFTLSSKL
ncbi:pollen allergen Sal k 5.0101-like [Gossypium arboreum]|uniref:pollen allergen Sal k 5.0101-like n=1 Tax=Gossypium arboreum TaxID=29729 RepID=UPI0022F172D3|nr:pollen allergen Sal k 5.0101-like [Gossypium arboreum]